MTNQKAWYQRNRLILPMLVLFPPVGTILVICSRWSGWAKVPVAILGLLYSIIFAAAVGTDPAPELASSSAVARSRQAAPPAETFEQNRERVQAPERAQPPEPRKNYDATLNEPVQGRDRTITATKITQSDGLSISNQFADPITGTIIYVEFTVENSGNDSGNIIFSSFDLEDSQGRSYDEITDLTYSLWRDEQDYGSRGDDMFPGESRREVAAFRVAPDANGFRMKWNGKTIKLQ